VATLAAAFLVPLGAHAAAGASDRSEPPRTYVVKAGDTVWSIAVGLAGPGEDPRPVVDDLMAANHLDETIVPGETLQLP
jgi:LysM repeat protein